MIVESLSIATAGPAPAGDIIATVYKTPPGETDFTRSPLPIRADEYFIRQTR